MGLPALDKIRKCFSLARHWRITVSIHYISASYVEMRSGDQTFIGPICTHTLDVVELALEGGIELGIWREHALCLAIDKAVP
jgi:hypothetical protein